MSMTNAQKVKFFNDRLAHIKRECHTAMNPFSLRDRLKEVIETLEFLFSADGTVSDEQPNVVPGVPAGQLEDFTKTRVEFVAGPGAVQAAQASRGAVDQYGMPIMPIAQQAPQMPAYQPPPGYALVPIQSATPDPAALPWVAQQRQIEAQPRPPRGPINSGDVQFIPGPPPGTSTGGQSVQFFNATGQPVDINGNLIGGQPVNPATLIPVAAPVQAAAAPPAPLIPGGDYGGAQRVEFIGGPSSPPPHTPGTPVSNNPAQIIHTQPTLTTEAGHAVAPIPGGNNGVAASPQSLEDMKRMIPIPTL